MAMKLVRSWLLLGGASSLTLLGSPAALAQQSPTQSAVEREFDATAGAFDERDSEDEAYEGIEFMTRGPLHEAFATPYSANPEPSESVTKEPPVPIQEVRPEFQPQGNNVQWIAGYWSFDDEKDDFVWISGLWRDLPPNMQWVAGYWAPVDRQFQRVVGFWANTNDEEIAYLPPPPRSIETGPSSPSPGDDKFYIPGTWVYESDNYVWRPGMWAPQQEDWMWTPATYIWTPRGCIYRQGYWDYEPTYRGVVFTPVYYTKPIYRQSTYRYRPRYVVNTNLALLVHLFVGPQQRNYYYGNYYGADYRNRYSPWVNYGQNNSNWNYDPLYAYYTHLGNRNGQNITQWAANRFGFFEKNEQLRPANTLSAQKTLLELLRGSNGANANAGDQTIQPLATLALDLRDVARGNDRTLKFDQLSREDQLLFDADVEAQRATARERLSFEMQANGGNANTNTTEPKTGNVAANGGKFDTSAGSNARGKFRLPRPDVAANASNDVSTSRNSRDSRGNGAVGSTKSGAGANSPDVNTPGLDARNLNANESRKPQGNDDGLDPAKMRAKGESLDDGAESADANATADAKGRTGDGVRNRARTDAEISAREAAGSNLPNADRIPNTLGGQAPGRNYDMDAARPRNDFRSGDMPQIRRETDRRSSPLPGIPGIKDSAPQPIPRTNNAIRGAQNSGVTPGVNNSGGNNPKGNAVGNRGGIPGVNPPGNASGEPGVAPGVNRNDKGSALPGGVPGVSPGGKAGGSPGGKSGGNLGGRGQKARGTVKAVESVLPK